MNSETPTDWIKRRAAELGFALTGICPAVSPPGARRLGEWLAAGYAGMMDYLENRQAAYHDPDHVLPGARSVVMLAMPYSNTSAKEPSPLQGRVARYAWGSRDYHDVIRQRLHTLADELKQKHPGAVTRGVVDTAPILERDFAQLAGLGWVGKNTLLLSKQAGSYFFLAGLLTDLELDYDVPYTADHCGSCTACLDACPTEAFAAPYVLDARRCISYLTIEMHGSIPADLRPGIGEWIFGCDICQEVCPWNRHAQSPGASEFEPEAELNPLDLPVLFELTEADFRSRFRHTPLWRAHRRGLLRSAAIALGNRGDLAALPALQKAAEDAEPIVRAAAAWALGRLDHPESIRVLECRRSCETDVEVLAEIAQSLANLGNGEAAQS